MYNYNAQYVCRSCWGGGALFSIFGIWVLHTIWFSRNGLRDCSDAITAIRAENKDNVGTHNNKNFRKEDYLSTKVLEVIKKLARFSTLSFSWLWSSTLYLNYGNFQNEETGLFRYLLPQVLQVLAVTRINELDLEIIQQILENQESPRRRLQKNENGTRAKQIRVIEGGERARSPFCSRAAQAMNTNRDSGKSIKSWEKNGSLRSNAPKRVKLGLQDSSQMYHLASVYNCLTY